MRWTWVAPLTNGAERGRRSRVVLTPRRWRQVLRSDAQDDGDNQARSPGRSRRKPLKPLCAGMPGNPALPVVTNSYAFLLCMRGCGCVGTRHSPRPSWANFLHNSGAFAPRERGCVTDLPRRRCDKRKPFAHASAGECHSPCHRPRRRAIQYCRGADDQSRGRGVLDTRFRGYDDWAGLQKRPFANASAGECHSPCHRREGGRSSIAEELMINRQAAAYWIPAFAGMTIGRGCKSSRLRRRAQANVTRRVIAREGGRSSIAEEPMINREAAAYWIPAFAGMTAGLRRTRVVCACERWRMSLAVSSPAKGDPVLQRSR